MLVKGKKGLNSRDSRTDLRPGNFEGKRVDVLLALPCFQSKGASAWSKPSCPCDMVVGYYALPISSTRSSVIECFFVTSWLSVVLIVNSRAIESARTDTTSPPGQNILHARPHCISSHSSAGAVAFALLTEPYCNSAILAQPHPET